MPAVWPRRKWLQNTSLLVVVNIEALRAADFEAAVAAANVIRLVDGVPGTLVARARIQVGTEGAAAFRVLYHAAVKKRLEVLCAEK